MTTSNLIPVFRTRTGMTHRRMEGSTNALPCNSRNMGFRGTPGVMAESDLAQARLCTKCFGSVTISEQTTDQPTAKAKPAPVEITVGATFIESTERNGVERIVQWTVVRVQHGYRAQRVLCRRDSDGREFAISAQRVRAGLRAEL